MTHVGRRHGTAAILGLLVAACAAEGTTEEPEAIAAALANEPAVALADGTQVSAADFKARVQAVDSELASIRNLRGVVATTKRSNGDLVDWIPSASQLPGVARPTALPPLWELAGVERSKIVTPEAEAIAKQLDAEEKGPPGSVPLYRHNPEHVAKFGKTYDEFLQKVQKPVNTCIPMQGCRYYGSARQAIAPFWGTYGIVNIWKPAVDHLKHGMSLMQLDVWTQGLDMKSETIEAGWMVQPDLFNADAWTHLFVFTTNDGYGVNSCYNNACANPPFSAWVQLSSTKFPGAQLTPTSVFNGTQREAAFAVYPIPGWYLVWFIDEWIGGFSAGFYQSPGLASGINGVDWYGEVNDIDDGVASKNQMGSGSYANAGTGKAAYIRQLYTWARNPDGSVGAKNLYAPTLSATDNQCYTILSTSAPGDFSLWLGGPGLNTTTCRTD
jgi:Neprosin